MKKLLVVVVLALVGTSCTPEQLKWWDQQADLHGSDENIAEYCKDNPNRCVNMGHRIHQAGIAAWRVAMPWEFHDGWDEARRLTRADVPEVAPRRIVVPDSPIQDPCLAWVAVGAYAWEDWCFRGGAWGTVSRNIVSVSVYTDSDGTVHTNEYTQLGAERHLPYLTVDAETIEWLLPYVWNRIELSGKPEHPPEVEFGVRCRSALSEDVSCAAGGHTIKTPGETMRFDTFLHELAHILTHTHHLVNPDVPSVIRSHAGSDMFRCVIQHMYVEFLKYDGDPGACGTQDVWESVEPVKTPLPTETPMFRCWQVHYGAVADPDGMGYSGTLAGDPGICDYIVYGEGELPVAP